MIDLVHSEDQARLQAFLARIGARGADLDEELRRTVDGIIGDVRRRGDEALVEYSARFDDVQMRPSELRVPEANLLRWASRVDARVVVGIDGDFDGARFGAERVEIGGRVVMIVEVDDPHQSSVTVKYTATGARINHATKAKTGIVSSGR